VIHNSESSQLALLADFIRQNSEFADQFDVSSIDLNGKNRIDRGRKQILYCQTSSKGWITARLFDVRTSQTIFFSGFEELKKNNFDAPKFYKPAVTPKSVKKPVKPFKDWLADYLALPVDVPPNVPYFSKKIGKDRLALIDGLRVGKYFGRDAAFVPLRNSNGEITSFQFFGDKALIGDSNKAFCEGVKGTSTRFGAALETSKRQFIGEGAATVISGYSVVKSDLDLSLESDCLINALNAGNIKTFVESNKEVLTNPFFFADNDCFNKPTGKNTGLLTAVEVYFKLGLQNENRIFVPIQNGLKCDFNDIENLDRPEYQLLSAKEVLKKFPLMGKDLIDKNLCGLNEIVYLKGKDGFTQKTIKEIITNHINKTDLTIQINRANKTYTCELLCNGVDYFLSAVNEFAIFFLPIEKFSFDRLRKGKQINFKGLREDDLKSLHDNALNAINIRAKDLMTLDCRSAETLELKVDMLDFGKYLPKSHSGYFLTKSTVFFKSGMGTGKTHLFNGIINKAKEEHPDIPILVISPLVSLIEDLTRRLGLIKYSDNEAFDSNQLITTLHSLIKHIERFEHSTGLLFIDEINHVLNLFNSTTLQCNTTDLFNRFKKLIKNAKNVYVADAYLSQQSLDFIVELRGENNALIVGVDVVESHNRSRVIFEHQSMLDNELFASIENNKNVACVCSSLNKTKELAESISTLYPNKKVIVINSESTGENEVETFLKNPNTEISKYDVIIYSPAISGGVSFDDLKSTPDFEIFGYFMPFVHTATDFMQMLGRFRRKSNIHLFVDAPNEISLEQKIIGLAEACKYNSLLLIELLEGFNFGENEAFITRALDLIREEIVRGNSNDLTDFIIALLRNEIEQKKYALHILMKLLDDAGYKDGGVISGKNEEAILISKESKVAVISKEVELIKSVEDISEIDAVKISKKHKRTYKESARLTRYKIEHRFKLNLTTENIRYVLTQENDIAAAYKLSVHWLSDSKLIEKALKEIDFESDSFKPTILRKYHLLIAEFLARLFQTLDIQRDSDGFVITNAKPVTLESCRELFSWVKTKGKNGKLAVIGIKPLPPSNNNRMNWIIELLRGFGLSVDKETKALQIEKPLIGKIAANLTR